MKFPIKVETSRKCYLNLKINKFFSICRKISSPSIEILLCRQTAFYLISSIAIDLIINYRGEYQLIQLSSNYDEKCICG